MSNVLLIALRMIGLITIAIIVFVLLYKGLTLIGPSIGGLLVSALNLDPTPRLAGNLEAIGTILAMIISVYVSIKFAASIVGLNKKNRKPRNQFDHE